MLNRVPSCALPATTAPFPAAVQNANNVLVSSSDTSINGLVAKIADLGLSRIISQQKSFKITHTVS